MKSVLLSRLLNVLEVIAPFKHFNKLREFVQMKLPPGFPVKLGKVTLTILVGLFCQNVCSFYTTYSKVLSSGKELLHTCKVCVAVDFRGNAVTVLQAMFSLKKKICSSKEIIALARKRPL